MIRSRATCWVLLVTMVVTTYAPRYHGGKNRNKSVDKPKGKKSPWKGKLVRPYYANMEDALKKVSIRNVPKVGDIVNCYLLNTQTPRVKSQVTYTVSVVAVNGNNIDVKWPGPETNKQTGVPLDWVVDDYTDTLGAVCGGLVKLDEEGLGNEGYGVVKAQKELRVALKNNEVPLLPKKWTLKTSQVTLANKVVAKLKTTDTTTGFIHPDGVQFATIHQYALYAHQKVLHGNRKDIDEVKTKLETQITLLRGGLSDDVARGVKNLADTVKGKIQAADADADQLKTKLGELLTPQGGGQGVVEKIKQAADDAVQKLNAAQLPNNNIATVAKAEKLKEVKDEVDKLNVTVKQIVQELKNSPTDTNAIKELKNKISNLQEASQTAKNWNLVIVGLLVVLILLFGGTLCYTSMSGGSPRRNGHRGRGRKRRQHYDYDEENPRR